MKLYAIQNKYYNMKYIVASNLDNAIKSYLDSLETDDDKNIIQIQIIEENVIIGD